SAYVQTYRYAFIECKIPFLFRLPAQTKGKEVFVFRAEHKARLGSGDARILCILTIFAKYDDSNHLESNRMTGNGYLGIAA
ncbi:MAG TPA: hypothetical protein PKH75_09405, partial [Bacillota bacterium]|nr:hypothetical protein [Bacillota bacterium]